jgi:hypothetical protein
VKKEGRVSMRRILSAEMISHESGTESAHQHFAGLVDSGLSISAVCLVLKNHTNLAGWFGWGANWGRAASPIKR